MIDRFQEYWAPKRSAALRLALASPVLSPDELYATSQGIRCGDPLCCGFTRAYQGTNIDDGTFVAHNPDPEAICCECGKKRTKKEGG